MENTNPLFAGYGKVDYTPDFPVGLAGYGGDFNRRNTQIVAHVYITCIAAGFVGPVRDELGALSGCLIAYFNGASGNQVRHSCSRLPTTIFCMMRMAKS